MKLLLHAPTAGALDRARSNARNLLSARPAAEIMIVANADAVGHALDHRDDDTDGLLRLCERTLARTGRAAAPGLVTIPLAIAFIVESQEAGWVYVRA